IWVESAVGKGSVFHFTIILPEAEAAVPRAMQAAAESLRGRRVLVVDDNETNRLILQNTLQNWGTQLTVASSRTEALKLVEDSVRTKQCFDLILLDSLMPGMDGYAVVRAIKQQAELCGPAIMMLSSSHRASDLEKCEGLGVHAVLTKPIGQRDLLQAICNALAQLHKTTPTVAPTSAPTATPATEHRIRVLVVEDNPINREVARGHLNKRGHLVVTANDGEQAIAEWRKNVFDIILMDIQMPIMDGPTATRRIRSEEKVRGGHVPIVAMTAHALKGTEEECLSFGMDSYVSKPLNRDRFIKVVETLARKDSEAQTAEKPASVVEAHETVKPVPEPAKGAEQQSPAQVAEGPRLIHYENLAQHVGTDPETQQHVVKLCLEAVTAKLPLFRVAMSAGDITAIKRISHYLRGSLGLLGLPALVSLGEEIEYHHDELGTAVWKERCEEFAAMLERIQGELLQVRAA
ncbi:MAG TPA: response regulator, partial [Opitutales bacterium]|nr:response regulator [Opitutales bacterium]